MVRGWRILFAINPRPRPGGLEIRVLRRDLDAMALSLCRSAHRQRSSRSQKCPDEVGTRRTGSFGESGRAWTARPDPFRTAPRTGATRPNPFRATLRVKVPRPNPFRARPRTGAARPDPFRARPRTGAARPDPFRATPKGGGVATETTLGETSRSVRVDLPVGGSLNEAGRLAPTGSGRREASERGVRRSSGRRFRG
jgi:hypothetical protein